MREIKEEIYLPFTVNSKIRKKLFTPDIELTAAVALFEAKRKKGYLFTGPEEVSFIARGYYPILAYPWREGCLLFDGESAFHYPINVEETSPPEGFIEEIEVAAGNRAQYLKALTAYRRLIRQKQGGRQVKVKSLIADKKLTASLRLLNRDRVASPPPAFTLPTSLTPEAVTEAVGKVAELWSTTVRDIEGLNYTFNLLEEREKFFEEKIEREVDWVKKSYGSTLKWMTSKVKARMAELDEKLKKTLEKAATTCEHRVATLLREKEKLRPRYRKLKLTEGNLAGKRRRAEEREDSAAGHQWSRELRSCQREILTVKQRITQLEEKEKELEANRFSLKRKLKERHRDEVEKERKRIREVEAERDSEVSQRLEDLKEMKERTSRITAYLKELIDVRRLQRVEIENLAFPWKTSTAIVIKVPFYVACYKGGARLRYEVLPPCIVQTSTGLTKTLKKAFSRLEARINTLLQPASKPLQEMLSKRLVKSLGQNPVLEQLINRSGASLDIRDDEDFAESLSKGLKALKVEGWLSERESERIVSLY